MSLERSYPLPGMTLRKFFMNRSALSPPLSGLRILVMRVPSIALPRATGSCGGRRGLTLVELLVVIAIVAGLIGLLLPAVQSARASARNVACLNNVKQISLAFQAHLSALRIFPTGGNEYWTPPTFSGGTPLTGEKQDAGWAFQILPYVEGRSAWQPAGASDTERQIAALAAVHPFYFCPGRRGPQSVTYVDEEYPGDLAGKPLVHGLIDYAGSNMDETPAASPPGTGLLVQAGTDRTTKAHKPGDVTDGLTKTLAVAEKRLNLALLGQWQPDDNEGYCAGWDEDTMRRTDIAPEKDFSGDGTGEERFGSSHAATFNAAFADGSARGISFTVDPEVFKCLGDINDGQAVSVDGN
jgi:prepilin-type N-terminal cleavage/methylation domain-containing protein